jgi:hypothetical protein
MSETDTGSAGHGVVISHQPILDLSHLTSAEQLAAIARVEHVATAIVPESLAAAWTAIPSSHVAATVYVPGGVNTRVHTGTLIVGGDGLGAEDDVLVVVGLLVVTSPVTGPVPKRIHVVGSVLAPRGSEGSLGPALAGGSGAVSYYPYADGQDIKVLTGQVRLSAAMLANSGGRPDDALIAAGQVTITGEVSAIGYRTVLIAGQLLAPAASRDAIEPAVQIQGQATWYEGTKPRVFNGDASLGPDFFRLLSEPASLIVLGDLTISEGVTETMLGEKLAGLTVFGDVTAPAGLLGAVQVLATDVFGDIRAAGDGLPG